MEKEQRLALLEGMSFGAIVAEEETVGLRRYFAQTPVWSKLREDSLDIVYGAKGSGKTALYLLLMAAAPELAHEGVWVVNVQDLPQTSAFDQLATESLPNDGAYDKMWRLYFLSLAARALKEHGVKHRAARKVWDTLARAGLFPAGARVKMTEILSSVFNYVRTLELEGELTFHPVSGQPTGKLRLGFRRQRNSHTSRGPVSVDVLLELVDECLTTKKRALWFLLDGLDAAFAYNRIAESREREVKALSSLLRVYLQFRKSSLLSERFRIKIFLRSDIWEQIGVQGLPSGDHIVRCETITWRRPALLNLTARRIVENRDFMDVFGYAKREILGNLNRQDDLFHTVFPRQMEVSATFDWILENTRDGREQSTPRDFIGLMNDARAAEIDSIRRGEDRVAQQERSLISRLSVREGMQTVSHRHLVLIVENEYPEAREWLEALRGGRPRLMVEDLASVWHVTDAEALARANSLHRMGAFSRIGLGPSQVFSVPLLFRPALGISEE